MGTARKPFWPIKETGLTELIGINEQVAQNDWCAGVGVDICPGSEGSVSGEILQVALYASEDGSGAIITETGMLFIFDADPSVSNGDANLAAAAWGKVVGIIEVVANDWVEEASGGTGSIAIYSGGNSSGGVGAALPIPFHSVGTLYFAYYHTGATTINSAAGDDEQLEFNVWYRRES